MNGQSMAKFCGMNEKADQAGFIAVYPNGVGPTPLFKYWDAGGVKVRDADDVGFITMPDGHRVAVAIFTRGGNDRPRTIAEAARAIYDGFKTALTWPFRPALSTQ